MFLDYKLTYEDKIKPEIDWINPKNKKHRVKILKMPIYVQFEGKELNISFGFGTSWMIVPYVNLAGMGYGQGSLEDPLYEPDFLTFTESGWHWVPINKEQGACIDVDIELEK